MTGKIALKLTTDLRHTAPREVIFNKLELIRIVVGEWDFYTLGDFLESYDDSHVEALILKLK